MTRLSEQPARKMAPVIHPDERLLAAAQYEHGAQKSWRSSEFARFAEALGLEPEADLAHPRREYGYLGVTNERLILADSPFFGSVKHKHVYLEAPIEQCAITWYDSAGMFNFEARMMLFQLPGHRFASVAVRTRWPGMFGNTQNEAIRALVDGVVQAFGDRATQIDPLRGG